MLKLKSLFVLVGSVLGALLLVSPAQGSVVQALELNELVLHADQIVLGRVLFSETFQYPDGQFGTWHRIQIEENIRGTSADEREVIVETLGGRIGDLAMHVEGEPAFSVGERVIVFMRGGGPYTASRPVGMGQGVMRVRTEQGTETVTQSREGMLLMRRNGRGGWQKSVGALPTKEPLDAFLSKVRFLVQDGAGGDNE